MQTEALVYLYSTIKMMHGPINLRIIITFKFMLLSFLYIY